MSAKQNDRQDRSEQRQEVTGNDAVRSPENRAGGFLEPFDISQ